MTSASLTAQPLWTRARAMFARALAAVGDPAAIAAMTSLPHAMRRRIGAWLAPLEHIVRKLLCAEAARLNDARSAAGWSAPLRGASALMLKKVAHMRGGLSEARGAKGEAARSDLDTSAPESWSVRFALSLPRDPRAVADAHAPRIRSLWGDAPVAARKPSLVRQPPAEDGARRLARRLEALRRVLENPRPHAARLARLLARAIRRFPEIAQRYWLAPARTGDYDTQDARLSVDVLAYAADAPSRFEDSS